MDFDYTTETITPDVSTVLIVGGKGALNLPLGNNTGDQPTASVYTGALRWSTVDAAVEYSNGTIWQPFITSTSAVQSIAAGTNISASGTGAGPYTGAVTVNVVSNPSFSGQVTSTVSVGTPPFVITSTDQVTNLTAQYSGNTLVTTSTSNTAFPVTLAPTTSTGQQSLLMGTAFTFNPSTSVLTIPSGGTVTGVADPVNSLDVVNLQYLQGFEAGLEWKQEVSASTTRDLSFPPITGDSDNGKVTYLTGVITSANNVVLEIDGVTISTLGQRVLVKNQVGGIIVATDTLVPGSGYSNGIGLGPYALVGTGVGATATFDIAGGLVTAVYIVNAGTGYADNEVLTSTALDTAQGGVGFATSVNGVTVGTISNGIYTLTQAGVVATTPWKLTRALDCNTTLSLVNATTLTTNGTANMNTGWTQTVPLPTLESVGNVWVQFTGAGSGVSSFVTTLSGLTPNTATTGAVSLGGTLGAISGGTGHNVYVVGDILYASTTTALSRLADVTAGSYLRSGGAATAPLWSTLVLPNSATTGDLLFASAANTIGNLADVAVGQVLVSGGLGVTPSYTASPTLTGLTLSGLTANSFLYSGAGSALTTTGAPTNGQLLIGNTGNAPQLGTIAVTTGNSYVTLGAGTVTLSGPKFWYEYTDAPSTTPSSTASQAIAIGNAAVASKYGQVAQSSGFFSSTSGAPGNAQNSVYMLRTETTTSGAAIAWLNGLSGVAGSLSIPVGSCYNFDADIVAVTYTTGPNVATGTAAWNIKGLISNFAGTAAIQGATSTTFIANSGVVGLVKGSVTATDTGAGQSLQFNVTGIAATNIRWVVTCRTTEVSVL